MSFQENIVNKPFAHKKLKTPCDSIPPCNNCRAVLSSPDCICEHVYVPEVQYEPIRPALCCCQEKPKKRFWQQWFGLKNCGCKTKKKSKLSPEIVCQPIQDDSLPPLKMAGDTATAPCKAVAGPCPRRVCVPPPNAICGCHFFFNIGKLSRRKRIRGNGPQSLTAKLDGGGNFGSRRQSICKVEDIPDTSDGYRYSACKKIKKESSDDGICIGLTLTKEETKYCENNPNVQRKDYSDNVYNQQNDSSDQILTLEIRKSAGKINETKNQYRTSILKENENDTEFDPQTPLTPRSESYMREVEPMLRKKRRASEKSSINDYHVTPHNVRRKETLDRRVSEILRKLEDIEQKVNVLEKKGTLCKGNKNMKIDIDGQKSTVSVHLRDGKNDDSYGYTNNRNPQSDAVIKQKHLKSQSPCRNSYDPVETHTYENNNQAKSKIVIKLPNDSNNARIKHFSHTFLPTEIQMCNNKPNQQSDYNTTWCQIANNLKMNSDGKCYCVTCSSRNHSVC